MKNLLLVIIGLCLFNNLTIAQPAKSEDNNRSNPASDTYNVEQAQTLLGDNFFGPEEIKTAFGLEISDKAIPVIPFTKADLQRAKELKQFLILRWPISIEKMNSILKGRTAYGGKIFFDYDTADYRFKKRAWYTEENFFLTDDSVLPYWVLVSNGLLPNSANKNYCQQTDVIAAYLKTIVYKNRIMPQSCQNAIEQWETQSKEVKYELTKGSETRADSLLNASLINRLFRPTPRDIIYDLILIYHNQKKMQLLKKSYALSRGIDKKGLRVYLGYFDAEGLTFQKTGTEDIDTEVGTILQMR